MKNVAVLGSTGSIGTNTLKVLRNNGERFHAVGREHLDYVVPETVLPVVPNLDSFETDFRVPHQEDCHCFT